MFGNRTCYLVGIYRWDLDSGEAQELQWLGKVEDDASNKMSFKNISGEDGDGHHEKNFFVMSIV